MMSHADASLKHLLTSSGREEAGVAPDHSNGTYIPKRGPPSANIRIG